MVEEEMPEEESKRFCLENEPTELGVPEDGGKDNKGNESAATVTLRLLHHISRIFQNRIVDERKGREGGIDRKLKRKIDEKKQAYGLRQD